MGYFQISKITIPQFHLMNHWFTNLTYYLEQFLSEEGNLQVLYTHKSMYTLSLKYLRFKHFGMLAINSLLNFLMSLKT